MGTTIIIILLILLLAGISIIFMGILIVWRMIRRSLGVGSNPNQSQNAYTGGQRRASGQSSSSGDSGGKSGSHGKVFSDNEGDYVDFQEVKE